MRGIPELEVRMLRENLTDIPAYALPAGFRFRLYHPGDEDVWTGIFSKADVYNVTAPELFRQQFGDDDVELARRQLFLCRDDGVAIGTTTAWYDEDYKGLRWGRVHWVAIVPEHQGKGLAKPLLTAALERLVELGEERAYLTTESPRLVAINLYLKFGFVPEVKTEQDCRIWEEIRTGVRNENWTV